MSAPKIRCAIYTRKSSEDGLEQSFNSLDAQHEACAAYIASQKHEGWILAKDRFDDGGVSGGTLERPALTRLLAEIEAGRIAMVVVYKIDRLTRALTDFAKLVDRFEAAGCSFVSVTQAFNTASSMGRLTLNVLLSFAQFEREVTAERIRDKIAASKKQGMWMGGLPPLGYAPHPDPTTRELVVNAAEAQTVQALFDLCDRHGSLARVEQEAAVLGLRSKHHHFRSGRTQGGNPLSRGQIHKILTNPVYLGRIRHKDKLWPGRHRAIIDQGLWDRVQATLQGAARRQRGQKTGAGPALLTGKLRDETGDRLTPSHSLKAGRRHTYYVSNRLIRGGPDRTAWRLPGQKLETTIAGMIAGHLASAIEARRLLAIPDLRASDDLLTAARGLVHRLLQPAPDVLPLLLVRGTLAPRTMTLVLDADALATALGVPAADLAPDLVTIETAISLRRRGVEAKLVIGDATPTPDPVLLRSLSEAHRWADALRSGAPLAAIAQRAKHPPHHIRSRMALAFLSPKIQRALLEGTQPPELCLERLVRQVLPLDWSEQERLCGLA